DDEYTGLAKSGSEKEIDNLAYILQKSAVVFGCSEEICQYYNSIFGCKATPLYKGCDLSSPIKTKVNDPIRIVYAGNLLYGRMEILLKVAEALEAYGRNGRAVRFEIYSNTPLSAEEEARFARCSCTEYMGRRDYEVIKRRLEEADIVLHAESFEEEQILKTKYSFSTKIIDCLQSGSVLLGIGPAEIASIGYIGRIPGACVIDDLRQLEARLSSFLDDAEHFPQRAASIRAFAQQYHEGAANAEALTKIIADIIKGRV
ncbi:MAG: hypothetical protein IKU27_02455, partial [Clostridia bacterium]|nr:hypothetical protein [Clostridia bacterium]